MPPEHKNACHRDDFGLIDLKDLHLVSTSACQGMTYQVMFLFAVWTAIQSGQTKPESVTRVPGYVV